MRKVIGIALATLLLLGVVACSPGQVIPRLFDSIEVYAAEGDGTIAVEGNIMAVFYIIADEQVLGYYTNAVIMDGGETVSVVGDQGSISGASKDYIAYGLYQYQNIYLPYEEDETGTPIPIPVYLDDLDLQEITADDLPHSEHIGKLTAVNPALAKPATVTRRYMGINYDIQCFVTQSIVDQWQAEDLGIGDFVLVSFIEESPNGVEKHVAIVTDKVYESW